MKPPKYWNTHDIQNWLGYIAKVYDITLESKNFEDIISGKQLKNMTSKEFKQRDFIYGDWIHNMLKKMFGQVTSGISKDTLSPFTPKNEDEFSKFFSNLFDENLCTSKFCFNILLKTILIEMTVSGELHMIYYNIIYIVVSLKITRIDLS